MSVIAKIRKDDIKVELIERKVPFELGDLKPALLQTFQEEISGIQRLPALLYHRPFTTLEEAYLDWYEIILIEPLHAIKGHIANLYEEIPRHLPDHEKKKLKAAIDASFPKDAKTGADYRTSLINVCSTMHGEMDVDFYTALLQLTEIQEIAYAEESQRSASMIFRFHMLTFLHAITIQALLESLMKMSSRRLYGQYVHSIVNHGPETLRVVSLTSVNAEDEERLFHPMKKLAVITSNHHPENILINATIRYQIRSEFLAEVIYDENRKHTTSVGKNKDMLPSLPEAFVPFSFIESKPSLYQSMLERVADFLLYDNSWTETNKGIQFHDKDQLLFEDKEVHHSTNHLTKRF